MDEAPIPQINPESAPKPESTPVAGTPESAPAEKKAERAPASPEQASATQGISLPAVQPPAMPQVGQVPVATTHDDDSRQTPLIADDVDVIEMEWVNQAKKVIRETKDDPHAQETAVEKLQRDYLKKRYGKEIKSSSS
jgi:hypothetical protein